MCGDSTSEADVNHLMAGQKADMVFTDPPYGISYNGNPKGEEYQMSQFQMFWLLFVKNLFFAHQNHF